MLNHKYFQTHQKTSFSNYCNLKTNRKKKSQPRFHTQRKYFIELKEKERLLQEKQELREFLTSSPIICSLKEILQK